MIQITQSQVLSGLMGVCVADALGVPVEFTTRSDRHKNPVTTMQGWGTHNLPPGTWSDDSSLTFCLAEALSQELLNEQLDHTLATSFCRWYNEAYWTPYNFVFDIGNTTIKAITRLNTGVSPVNAGGTEEHSNGNGSLMRILPIVFCYQLVDFNQLIEQVHRVSCLTHAHLRSQIACGIYISIAVSLLKGYEPIKAYHQGIKKVQKIYHQVPYFQELKHFQRIIDGNIMSIPVEEIHSSGYVIHTLEASLWCFLKTSNYETAVLTAVNLGEDTDTTAAVTGGLAGIYYGINQIPNQWLEQIARKDDIFDLAARLEMAINQKIK